MGEFIKDRDGFKKDAKVSWNQNSHILYIPDSKKNTFEKLIKKLSRFSKTIGFPEPSIKELGTVTLYRVMIKPKSSGDDVWATISLKDKPTSDNWYDGESYTFDLNVINKKIDDIQLNGKDEYRVTTDELNKVELTIVDDVKPLEEWIILGTIDYKDELVKPAPQHEVPMELIKNANLSGKSVCDHCHKTINRNKTVFVENTEDGEIKQVGGQCIKYYLGYDYERVLSYVESLYVALDTEKYYDEEMFGFGGQRPEVLYSVTEIVRYFYWYVKTYNNIISKKAASEHNDNLSPEDSNKYWTPTSETVFNTLKNVYNRPEKGRMSTSDYQEELEQWEKTVDLYEEQIKTVKESDVTEFFDYVDAGREENNFLFNVSNIIKKGFIEDKFANYITGVCTYFYIKKLSEERKNKEKEDKPKSTSEYVGTIGEKIALEEVEIIFLKDIVTEFGMSLLYKMKDKNGNILAKFGKIPEKILPRAAVQVGTKLSFTADVKDHSEFNGEKQTMLGRVSKHPTITNVYKNISDYDQNKADEVLNTIDMIVIDIKKIFTDIKEPVSLNSIEAKNTRDLLMKILEIIRKFKTETTTVSKEESDSFDKEIQDIIDDIKASISSKLESPINLDILHRFKFAEVF